MAKIAVLVGATGLIGGHLLNLLVESPHYDQVYVLGRRAPASSHPKIHFIRSDFSPLHLTHEIPNHVRDVFCCLGTTIKKAGSQAAFRQVDYQFPIDIAKAAKAKGAHHFLIVTAMGAKANSSIFYNKVKGEVEQAIGKLDFPRYSIFRPSLLMGEREEQRTAEDIGKALAPLMKFLLRGPLKKYQPIAGLQVAQAMYQKAQEAGEGKNIILNDQMV
ncbi:NAD(P)H-binding protein [Persicobacter diffluens]|uniref:Nucleoside-diphosphate sugar epimerase n=1 Tax=Persicobacter diffluens TaxID=981 RepID=A0AAN4VU63_9BACT|nr:nucleoside-diphosphate sugar epimerase [Persicobacter diffluens]